MFQNMSALAPAALPAYQDSTGMPGAEDSPETHQWMMERGRKRKAGLPSDTTQSNGD